MESVLHHESVVEAVRKQGPALPVRFGTVFRDATSVASALAERYAPLTADLDRLGDKVELSMTALWATPPSEEERTITAQRAGARYLQARAAEVRREEALKARARAAAEQLDQLLCGLALDQRVTLAPTPRVALRSAYLLDQAQVTDFQASFEAMRSTAAELRFLLTGPWPPYSFVTRTEESTTDRRVAELLQLLTDEMQGRARTTTRG
jgi:hypothetical protein